MLADYPAAYENQPGFDFLQLVPTWWDETRVLVGEVGQALVTARRKGKTWYVGGLFAGRLRQVDLPLSFLGKRHYTIKIWKDANDSEANPNHLSVETQSVTARDVLKIKIAPDGGFVAQVTAE